MEHVRFSAIIQSTYGSLFMVPVVRSGEADPCDGRRGFSIALGFYGVREGSLRGDGGVGRYSKGKLAVIPAVSFAKPSESHSCLFPKETKGRHLFPAQWGSFFRAMQSFAIAVSPRTRQRFYL